MVLNTKANLRKQFISDRAGIELRQAHEWQARMLDFFANIPIPPNSRILSYRSMPEKNEIPMEYFEDFLMSEKKGLELCYPAIDSGDGSMEAYLDDESLEWETVSFGLKQPASGNRVDPRSVEVILLPLLTFDRSGHRLGYGKGYFDRYLVRCRPSAVKIGFSWFEPMEELPEIQSYDIPLDYCVTPEKLYVF
jgi:5-formyltetrahydrofolate cyclo-ligase